MRGGPGHGPFGHDEMSFSGKVVKGAPLLPADGVIETTQTLSDGKSHHAQELECNVSGQPGTNAP